ncbi:MAG: ABC transporter permease [Aerococcus sp.]|nr:ABC transporter permease [Aerococcus sp.]
MFLAINEIRHSKLRYVLVTGVMFLIAYLVFFLTGLAYGLAEDGRLAVDQWQADQIVMTEDADNSLDMSIFTKGDANKIKADDKALLATGFEAISKENSSDKIKVNFFGIDPNQFLMPKVTEGRSFTSENEVVADESLVKQYGIGLNDTIKVGDHTLKIVGLTKDERFRVSPVLFTSLKTYEDLRYNQATDGDHARINAVVVRGDIDSVPEDFKASNIKDFINDLPGYSAQVMTFGLMIGFLIVIAAIVIGIFVYVLTMQKSEIFGVMKAQGISSGFIARSVIAQTFLLSATGVILGLLLTLGTSAILPVAVPFTVNGLFFGGISVAMIVIAVIGALFSVRTIVKIDPLKAIG